MVEKTGCSIVSLLSLFVLKALLLLFHTPVLARKLRAILAYPAFDCLQSVFRIGVSGTSFLRQKEIEKRQCAKYHLCNTSQNHILKLIVYVQVLISVVKET